MSATAPSNLSAQKTWLDALKAFNDRRVLVLLFLGFFAGLPYLLVFSSLSLWLGEAGIERKLITMFSWAALGYSFKFVWAPLVDTLPLPVLTRWLGRRRAWLILAQVLVVLAIVKMAFINPALGDTQLQWMALAAMALGFSSATQDIVIDAYRIEYAPQDMQPLLSSGYTMGYRIGMIVSGAGALFLAEFFGTSKEHYVYTAWQYTYLVMAAVMCLGMVITLRISEPKAQAKTQVWPAHDYVRMIVLFAVCVVAFIKAFKALHQFYPTPEALSPLLAFARETSVFLASGMTAALVGYVLVSLGAVNRAFAVQTWVQPVRDFFVRYGVKTALTLLLFIGFYRVSDIVFGVISNTFYQELGFSKKEIGTAIKTIGVIITIFGTLFGGVLVQRYSIYKVLLLGAILASLSNVVFIGLNLAGHNLYWFYSVVFIDNFSAGIATAALMAFLSGLTNVSFTASQYAIFSSLMTLFPKVLGGYSGSIVSQIGYNQFFMLTACMGLPVLLIIYWVQKQMDAQSQTHSN